MNIMDPHQDLFLSNLVLSIFRCQTKIFVKLQNANKNNGKDS